MKIADVGVSKAVNKITGTLAGTPVYMAPEVFHSQLYDTKADIYSLGIILWEMWYEQQAFSDVSNIPSHVALFAMVDEAFAQNMWKVVMSPHVVGKSWWRVAGTKNQRNAHQLRIASRKLWNFLEKQRKSCNLSHWRLGHVRKLNIARKLYIAHGTLECRRGVDQFACSLVYVNSIS